MKNEAKTLNPATGVGVIAMLLAGGVFTVQLTGPPAAGIDETKLGQAVGEKLADAISEGDNLVGFNADSIANAVGTQIAVAMVEGNKELVTQLHAIELQIARLNTELLLGKKDVEVNAAKGIANAAEIDKLEQTLDQLSGVVADIRSMLVEQQHTLDRILKEER